MTADPDPNTSKAEKEKERKATAEKLKKEIDRKRWVDNEHQVKLFREKHGISSAANAQKTGPLGKDTFRCDTGGTSKEVVLFVIASTLTATSQRIKFRAKNVKEFEVYMKKPCSC